MEKTGKINSEDLRIQGLLDRYLNLRAANDGSNLQDGHLDEDSLTAFVEGNLSLRESQPLVEHLVDCSFCRHITAELVKLDAAFAGEEASVTVTESQPSKVSEVLNGLLSRIFGSAEGTVFAHHESEDKPEKEEEEKKE